MERLARFRRFVGPVLVITVFAVALWLLHHELKHYHLAEIRRSLNAIPAGRIALAAGFAALSYVILICYDLLAVRSLGHPLSMKRIAFASFTGYVSSHNFGTLLGGTSVRFRLYSAWGFSAVEIVRLVSLLGLTFWVGVFALGGAVFLADPFPLPAGAPLSGTTVRPLGGVLLAWVVLYFALTAWRSKPIRIRGMEFPLPQTATAAKQLVVAAADFTSAAAVLYVLLPASFAIAFPEFLGIYLLAVVVVVFSHVPGGVGVFELTVMKLAGAETDERVLAALLIFRVLYYLLPLLAAALLLTGREVWERRAGAQRVLTAAGRALGFAIPSLLASATFAAGVVLLWFGSIPPLPGRLKSLEELVPLFLLEMSHFLASLIGAALLVLARGLQRRLDSAWWLTAGLLGAAIPLSLLKGSYEPAAALAVILTAVLASRRRFYRHSSLLHAGLTPGWLTAVILVVLCTIWLGLFAHRHVEYATELWWKFAFHSHAPRFLRATAGVLGLLLIVALSRLLRRHAPPLGIPGAADLESAEAVIRGSRRTETNLALLGDKSLLFNENRTAFVMYAVQGRSWVSLGDPVGPENEREELLWQFREMVDRYDGWPFFYQVDEEDLTFYLDQGLTLLKLGEEGRVPLERFSLEGAKHKSLRRAHHKLQRENCTFEIVPRESVSAVLPDLKAVSDTWLAEKPSGEKGFSLGFYCEDYLRRFPCAVVRKDGELLAFANLLQGAEHEELSIDLMRYRPNVFPGLMDFLFIELMLWGKAQEYRWFNLGMAPLSGIEDRPLAPLWNRAVGLVFRHGEHFYGFRGLREYKEKFGPQWRPKYLASPGGLALPRILTDITTLINRRARKTIS